jgi:SnoaL-like domain
MTTIKDHLSNTGPENAYDRTAEALRVAGESLDIESFLALLAPDVIVRSPITQHIRFEGHEQASDLFRRIFTMVSEIRIKEFIGQGQPTQVMLWKGSVGGTYLEEANVLRFDEDGRVCEMTVFMRALPGLLRLASEIAPSLAGRRSRLRALVVRAALAPISVLYRTGEPAILAVTGAGVRVPPETR